MRVLNENHRGSNIDRPIKIGASVAAKLEQPPGESLMSPEPLKREWKERRESESHREFWGGARENQGMMIGIFIQVLSAPCPNTP